MRILLFLLILLPAALYAQNDSTTLIIKTVEDKDLKLSNELNGIQIMKLVCPDTTVLGKRFKLQIHEYKGGEIVDQDSFGLTCEDQRFPVVIGQDTMYYTLNLCEKFAYTEDCIKEEFQIKFGGKLNIDTFDLRIKYPGIYLSKKLKGDDSYLLKSMDCIINQEFRFPLNEMVPILAYTPPFKTGQIDAYCLLDTKEPGDWHIEYKLDHFYIFYLEIE